MKTVLAALNAKHIHSNLAIRYLKAYADDDNIEIYDATINENPLNIAIDIARKKPDLVGFSCYIWNIENTLKVCSALKEIDGNIFILLGGPEVTYDSKAVLERYEYIDFIIQGEGERPFKNFICKLKEGKKSFEDVEGLVYRCGDKIIENHSRSFIENLDEIPFPYKDGITDRIIYYETTRGCPFSCKYCLSSIERGLRYFSLDRVKSDLKYFIDRDVKIVKFVDRTFNANKKFAMEIWKYLIENRKNTTFHFEIAADILDRDAIEILKGAPDGLFQFEVGVQTTNPEVLNNINRTMDFEKLKRNVLEIKKSGNIHCHLDLIAGLPGEDFSSFRRSFDMCMDMNPDVLQLGFLKILKGSPMYYESHKYIMHYTKFPPYQVLKTRDITFDEMVSLMELEEVFESYYNSGIFSITMFYALSKVHSKFDFFMDFTGFLKDKGFFSRNMSLNDRFKLLYEFLLKYCNENIIRDVLLHDYIINTKKSVVPDFLKRENMLNLKDLVYENRSKIEKYFGRIDFKRIFYVPVDVKILKDMSSYSILEERGIAVFNLEKGEYMYLQ
ncbi:B12-binding domain-containing radical SAM protein [Fonticella tunisiensis]|uniref:Radical SAM superfamily enzyme YgiQ (UPF0313 family) n=1 Tax=Fonticella tunisiensis TaxID=1096341 RepID=A0A4R7KCE1_9CLOT|nr:radical SAM protein [Fonticella tunisiensis]TDT50933.1 radical SAM superfamily enzyme YgiQ (UPF0313 family) [Fonticella tunisiensis]